jgi:hypothetical protein
VAIPFLFICGFVTVYFLGQKGNATARHRPVFDLRMPVLL